MSGGPLHDTHHHHHHHHQQLLAALEQLSAHLPIASDDELMSVLTLVDGVVRRAERVTVTAVAALLRRGTFVERGYGRPEAALRDLLGWERSPARSVVTAAEQTTPRTTLDGASLPPRLPATALAFAAGTVSVAHVAAIDRILSGGAASRLAPQVWADAEAQLAAHAAAYTPSELRTWGEALIELLDADGAEPDDDRALVNELHLQGRRRGGGTITGRFEDAAMFDAIASAIDAHSRPFTGGDGRSLPQRQAEALADVCGYVLDHADLLRTAGRRPHLNVTVRWSDLQGWARGAVLDLGGELAPARLRMLACDAAVIPVVLGGDGQPLDVGRSRRTIPDGLRRAVTVRDRGCAHCGRPPSWYEVHHIVEWEHGRPTSIDNVVMVCRACHRMIHHSGWTVRLTGGLPEFLPPAWIDPDRRPRRRAVPWRLDAA